MSSAATIRAILFDVDGTLVDTYRLYLESYRRALEPVLGYRPADEEIVGRAPSAERRFLLGWVGEERLSECHADMCRHYESLHGSLVEGLYDGVPEMLRALRSAGAVVGVVTSKGRSAWEVTDRELDLGRFEVVVTEDDVAIPKPDPAGLLAALQAIGTDPAEAVYIGDSAGDLQAGRNAGIRVGAALWPKTDPDDLQHFLEQIAPLAPDWIFERPAEVTRAFAGWC